MNCYKAPDDKLPKEKIVHPPKVNGDELCDTPDCNHQRRKHIFDRSCGDFPCTCAKFVPSERFYDWENQLVPDVLLKDETLSKLEQLKENWLRRTQEYKRLRYGSFDNFIVGITGTEDGMSARQDAGVRWLLTAFKPWYLRHGDCIGVDYQVACIADEFSIKTISHPPIYEDFRAKHKSTHILEPKEFLERDDDIARQSHLLIACPREMHEITRSGTWATVRYARKHKTPRIILLP